MSSLYRACLVYVLSFNLLVYSLPVQQTSRLQRDVVQEPGEEGDLFEGDIKLIHGDRKRRSVMQDLPIIAKQPALNPSIYSGTLWPNGTVYFKFHENISFEISQTFLTAIGIWEQQTCLEFQRADENTTAYLLLTDTDGCSSYIGRVGTVQEVSISSSCRGVGHALHELGHAVGLWHEHTRPDRENYIKIIWDNIKESAKTNFQTYNHPNSADVKYDFGSVMHYPETAFAIDKRKPTIEIIYKPFPSCIKEVGQRHGLSFKDKLRVNKLYGCQAEIDESGDDPCPLPSPLPTTATPTPTPTVATTTSTELPKPTPTCTVSKSFRSETRMTIPFSDTNFWNLACHGEYCQKDNCSSPSALTHYNECKEQYFVMYLALNRKNRYIKDGDTIAMQSSRRTGYWMDCSRGNCTLTQCADNTGRSITNFTRDICSQHKLKIFAVDKKLGKRIQSTDLVYFKSDGSGSDKYLNCFGKKCQLITEGSDCNETDYSGASGSLCYRQLFKLKKHVTECL